MVVLLPFRVLRASLVLTVFVQPLHPAHGPRTPLQLIPLIPQESAQACLKSGSLDRPRISIVTLFLVLTSCCSQLSKSPGWFLGLGSHIAFPGAVEGPCSWHLSLSTLVRPWRGCPSSVRAQPVLGSTLLTTNLPVGSKLASALPGKWLHDCLKTYYQSTFAMSTPWRKTEHEGNSLVIIHVE